jgi:hypothetical protein
LRNENADIENPIGSRVIPPITAIFNELLFITLPIMAWTIYQAVGNRHVVVPKQKKKRLSPHLRRSNSMDSRRTLPTEMLIIENPSAHQNPFQGYVLEKPRTQSMDKTRDSSKPNLAVEHNPDQEISDESFTNLTVNVRNFKRNTASMISN